MKTESSIVDINKDWTWHFRHSGRRTQFKARLAIHNDRPWLEAILNANQLAKIRAADKDSNPVKLIGVPHSDAAASGQWHVRALFMGFRVVREYWGAASKNRASVSITTNTLAYYMERLTGNTRQGGVAVDFRTHSIEARLPGLARWLYEDTVRSFNLNLPGKTNLDGVIKDYRDTTFLIGANQRSENAQKFTITTKSGARMLHGVSSHKSKMALETESSASVNFREPIDILAGIGVFKLAVEHFFDLIFCQPHSNTVFGASGCGAMMHWEVFVFDAMGGRERSEEIGDLWFLGPSLVSVEKHMELGRMLENWVRLYDPTCQKVHELLSLLKTDVSENTKFVSTIAALEEVYIAHSDKSGRPPTTEMMEYVASQDREHSRILGKVARMPGVSLPDIGEVKEKIRNSRNELVHHVEENRGKLLSATEITEVRYALLIYIHIFLLELIGADKSKMVETMPQIVSRIKALY